jgi:hypothetical protein
MSEFKPISKLQLGDRVRISRAIWQVSTSPYWSDGLRSMVVIVERKGKQRILSAYTVSKDRQIAKAVGVEVVDETSALADAEAKRKRKNLTIQQNQQNLPFEGES